MIENKDYVIKDTVDPPRYALTFPIYQTAAYSVPDGEKYRYSRELNPTVEELQRQISILEKADKTVCFSSGMGAITTTLLTLLKPEDKVITTLDTFARSSRFIKNFLSQWGVRATISDPGSNNLISEISDKSIVFIESISNPLLRVYDISRIAKKVHSYDGILIVDSTLATPENINPLHMGADLVVHSLSKFMSGHNDIIGGSVSGNSLLIDQIDLNRRTMGTNMDANTAFLVLRGLKTLHVRMKDINKNGISVARNLASLDGITNVNYPGLETHPDFDYSMETLRGYSGIITFDAESLAKEPYNAFSKLRTISAGNSLGSVNSIIAHPLTMSHRSLNEEELKKLQVKASTFRLSVGLEDPQSIMDDIKSLIQP
jgi:cystathionine gamma-synthase